MKVFLDYWGGGREGGGNDMFFFSYSLTFTFLLVYYIFFFGHMKPVSSDSEAHLDLSRSKNLILIRFSSSESCMCSYVEI